MFQPLAARVGARHRFAVLIAGLALVIGQLVALASASSAAAVVCPNRATDGGKAHWVAAIASVANITGISANIEQYNPAFTSGNGAGTNGTVMLTESSHTHWVQLGWFKAVVAGVVQRRSGANFGGNGQQPMWFAARPIGESTPYEVLAEANNQFNMFINGTYVAAVTNSFTPSIYEVFGETHDRMDQMPGGSGNHVAFLSMQYHTGALHTPHWATATFGTGDVTDYGFLNPSTSNGEIWDKGQGCN